MLTLAIAFMTSLAGDSVELQASSIARLRIRSGRVGNPPQPRRRLSVATAPERGDLAGHDHQRLIAAGEVMTRQELQRDARAGGGTAVDLQRERPGLGTFKGDAEGVEG